MSEAVEFARNPVVFFFVSLSLQGRLSVFLFGSAAHCGAAGAQIPTSCMKARVLPAIPAGRSTALQSVQRVKEAT